MFEAKRAELLERCKWNPSPERDLLGYIEAWWAADEVGHKLLSTGHYHCRRGFLTDDEVDDWIHQRHQFAAPCYSSAGRSLSGKLSCLRLLACERLGWQPPEFAMSRESFIRVEESFGLPRAALPLICRSTGMEYYRLGFGGRENSSQSLPSVSVVIKYPQMFQIGNLGFSMTYSPTSGNTLAFLHGWSIFKNKNLVTNKEMVSHAERIYNLLESSVPLWRHPLLLPTLLLQEHLFRCEEFIWRELSPQIRGIERVLGVTESGRLAGTGHKGAEAIRELLADDEHRIRITSEVNTTLTDTITFVSILRWDQRLCEFIKRVDKELHRYYEAVDVDIGTVKELESAVDHFWCEAMSSVDYVTGMRTRLEIQLTVLYNFVAQAGNDLNSCIAATAGLDSAAMKTLAFVTTVFLPLSFVASLFSIPMFNWQASSQDGSSGPSVVSSRFWIYWVVSGPLTAVVLVGWHLWWKRQKAYYALKYPQALARAGEGKLARVKEV